MRIVPRLARTSFALMISSANGSGGCISRGCAGATTAGGTAGLAAGRRGTGSGACAFANHRNTATAAAPITAAVRYRLLM
jgi:hypothetical protein